MCVILFVLVSFSFLFSSFFLLLSLLSPLILVLSLLELSLSLDFAQIQTHMPQAPLSNQWVSLFGIFLCGFLCIWCCWLAVVRWRAWVCGDRHGGGLSLWIGVVEGVGLWWPASVVEFWWWHRSKVWIGRWWVAWLFSGWIGNGWWLDWSLVVGFSGWDWSLVVGFGDGIDLRLVVGFVHKLEFGDGFRSQIEEEWRLE